MDITGIEDVIGKMELERSALLRYHAEMPKARILARRYEAWHELYAPPGGDQWPEDRLERPNKLHITNNIVRPMVDVDARLESILPRITNKPNSQDPEVRQRSEATEKLFLRYLEMSGWDVWMFTQGTVKRIYGKVAFKPFWNEETEAPDVYVIEQPQHLLIGWGDNDYSTIDWTIYRGRISPLQVRLRYPDAPEEAVRPAADSDRLRGQDHSDPLDQQLGNKQATNLRGYGYEAHYAETWDYWYIRNDGMVCNATFVNGYLVDGPHEHPEYPAVPYIVVEYDHEPGDPEGHGMVEALYDLQMGLNRAMSHMAQYIWDNTDPAYQLVGESAPMTVPEGIVPAAGEIVAPGPGSRIEVIGQNVNQFPLADLIRVYNEAIHKVTGLPEVLFGALPGSQTSGRAVSVQIEAAINRLDPRRRRMYDALRQILLFWAFMIKVIKPKFDGMPINDVIDGLNYWKIVAPEITPRDVIEHTMNTINKLNAKMVSLETAMDEVGVENPIEEMNRVMQERTNAHLFPGDAQAIAAVMATLQQLQAAAAQMGSAGQAQEAAMEGVGAQDAALADQQEASPTGFEDQNAPVPQAGSAPPPGSPGPLGGELQPLVRQTPSGESQSLSQIVLPRREV